MKKVYDSYTYHFGDQVKERYGEKCWYCGEKLTKSTFTVDHFIPNKDHSIENLRPACKSCNSRKRDRDIEHMRMLHRLKKSNHPDFITPKVIEYLSSIGIELDGIPEHVFYFEAS